MRSVSVDHYENFPVASFLCPPRLRPAIEAIYAFARTADDLADEGDASAQRRLAELADYRRDLARVVRGDRPGARWQRVFEPLSRAQAEFGLPPALLSDLLDAFEQDVVKQRYADRAELLDYCRRSANPIGRLLLHLYGIDAASALMQSDAICTGLQLTNFWQDLAQDTARGRLYLPLDDCRRHGVDPAMLLERRHDATTRALIADAVQWARSLLRSGAPLVQSVPGRAGWELRLVVQGGLRVLQKIEQMDFATLRRRPRLTVIDAPALLWRTLWMRPSSRPSARQAA
jgi:squalene synthase HpnC